MNRKNVIIVILCIMALVLCRISIALVVHLLNGPSYTRYEEADGTEYLVTRDGVKIADPVMSYMLPDGGWKTAVYIENNTSKEIKYITTVSRTYNRVGDPAQLDYEYDNEVTTELIGPIGQAEAYYFSSYEFDSETMEYVVLKKIEITYMDGTSEIISGINMEHRYINNMSKDDTEHKKKYDAYYYIY